MWRICAQLNPILNGCKRYNLPTEINSSVVRDKSSLQWHTPFTIEPRKSLAEKDIRKVRPFGWAKEENDSAGDYESCLCHSSPPNSKCKKIPVNEHRAYKNSEMYIGKPLSNGKNNNYSNNFQPVERTEDVIKRNLFVENKNIPNAKRDTPYEQIPKYPLYGPGKLVNNVKKFILESEGNHVKTDQERSYKYMQFTSLKTNIHPQSPKIVNEKIDSVSSEIMTDGASRRKYPSIQPTIPKLITCKPSDTGQTNELKQKLGSDSSKIIRNSIDSIANSNSEVHRPSHCSHCNPNGAYGYMFGKLQGFRCDGRKENRDSEFSSQSSQHSNSPSSNQSDTTEAFYKNTPLNKNTKQFREENTLFNKMKTMPFLMIHQNVISNRQVNPENGDQLRMQSLCANKLSDSNVKQKFADNWVEAEDESLFLKVKKSSDKLWKDQLTDKKLERPFDISKNFKISNNSGTLEEVPYERPKNYYNVRQNQNNIHSQDYKRLEMDENQINSKSHEYRPNSIYIHCLESKKFIDPKSVDRKFSKNNSIDMRSHKTNCMEGKPNMFQNSANSDSQQQIFKRTQPYPRNVFQINKMSKYNERKCEQEKWKFSNATLPFHNDSGKSSKASPIAQQKCVDALEKEKRQISLSRLKKLFEFAVYLPSWQKRYQTGQIEEPENQSVYCAGKSQKVEKSINDLKSETSKMQGTTYTLQQNINAKLQLKTSPAEHAASRWRSISEQTPLISLERAAAAQSIHQLTVDHSQLGSHSTKSSKAKAKMAKWKSQLKSHHVHQAHRAALHKEAKPRLRRDTEEEELEVPTAMSSATTMATSATVTSYANRTLAGLLTTMKAKRARSTVHLAPEDLKPKPKEPVIIIDDVEEFDSGTSTRDLFAKRHDEVELVDDDGPVEGPRALPLRPVLPNPYEDEEMSVVYAEQHSEIRLMCEVDLDISSSMWYKNGQVVHAMDRTTRVTDYRFIKEANGALTITNVMLEDDGKWQCEAENTRRYTENARTVKLVVLDRPKPPYLLIDSRRLDAGNIFVPVKENSELNLACVSEGGNPRPTLTWEVLLSPGVDRHAQKVSAEVLELEEIKNEKDKNGYKINSGAKSEARLPAVYRAHHNARILCVMEHPTLKIRQNASLLLDVQYTPSFAISRTPGFGYPLREGIEVSLKCDVDSNPPSTPRWQKDDGDTPVPQTGDGFLNFTSIRREHSGWYKCTSRHLNFQYSSIGYYLSVRYDSVDVTSEPDDQDVSVAAASHNPNKGQLEVQLGGAVTLQCPQGSLGCWSHLDPVSARLRGLGYGSSTPTGQFSLKDVMYQDAGTYKCVGQSLANKKKLEVLQSVIVSVKGAPTVMALNATPVAYPGSPLHLNVEFCANPPAHAARWLHGDRVFTPGNQYGSTVLAYSVKDLPTPYCKEARLTYVSMHERVPRTFYFIVSSPGGVAEAVFNVNFTKRHRQMSNTIDDDEEEELNRPEQIHFPVFSNNTANGHSLELKLALVLALFGATLLHAH